MNKQDHDELLNQGLTQQEIDFLTQKGFTKEEMMQTHLYNNEIKKGSGFHCMACRYHHLAYTLKEQFNHCPFFLLCFCLFEYIF